MEVGTNSGPTPCGSEFSLSDSGHRRPILPQGAGKLVDARDVNAVAWPRWGKMGVPYQDVAVPDLSHLTDQQRAVVDHPVDQHGRVLAGPGTGKSFTAMMLLGRLALLERGHS